MFTKNSIMNDCPPKPKGVRGISFIIIIVLLFSLFSFPVGAVTYKYGYDNLYVTGIGEWSNSALGTFIPVSATPHFDITYFDNAVSFSADYGNPVVTSQNQSNSWSVWLDPTSIGSYSFIFAINYSSWRVLGCEVDGNSAAHNISNCQYKSLNNVTSNGVTFSRIQVTFDVNSLDKTNEGHTGDYFNFSLRTTSNISANGTTARIYDFKFSNDTDKIIENQNSNTDREIQADKDNTQSIIDNQNQIAENEKNETQNSANSAVDGAENIPDKSQGFISAMGSLVSAMSYNGTDASWTLPSIYLPAISNVMDKKVLTEDLEIDFSYWVEKIPDNILSLVRSVLTVALIVFCFKELYSTISYVLTLKGGGDSE